MNNKGYNNGQNRYIEGGHFKSVLQVVDVQAPRLSVTGGWTYSTAHFHKITLSECLPDGEFKLYTVEPSKGITTWNKWKNVIQQFNKGLVVELTGKWKIASNNHKHPLLSTKSNFSITDSYTEEHYAKCLEALTGKEIPVEPDIFDK